ncbi:MAG: hypothetical protein Pars2KO_08550 [Parasphingorhabdus sp.]
MSQQANPFNRLTVIIMAMIGFAAFVALLAGMGLGEKFAPSSNGQAHGASNSIVGYKALSNLMEKTGADIQYSRNKAGYNNPGLLILTPNPYSDAQELADVAQNRSYVGPTLIILPKWAVAPMPTLKQGWVARGGTFGPEPGQAMLKELADVEIQVPENPKAKSTSTAISAFGNSVKTPISPVTMSGDYVRTVVREPKTGRALAAYLDDGGSYAQLDSLDPSQITAEDEIDSNYYPILFVADADLLNNAGMADKQTAKHALALVNAVSAGDLSPVTFDLTFNGLGASDNLLTLAFEPPFLSATICLIIAAIAAAWMAFYRFGPPLKEARSIEYGKTALVNNSASFINRMQRQYLAAEPYADMVRDQAITDIGISSALEDSEKNRALDALGDVNGYNFSVHYHALKQAKNSHEVANAAAALFEWKKEKVG